MHSKQKLLGMLLAGALCGAGCEWKQSDAFVSELDCGMSPERVRSLAENYGVDSFQSHESPPKRATHFLSQRYTTVDFYFGDDELETVQVGVSNGLTGIDSEPLVNLCTGEVSSETTVILVASDELAGAEVLVDGEQVSRLPRANLGISMWNGPHVITIRKEGYEEIRIPVDFSIDHDYEKIKVPEPVPLGGG